jgi:hypothetical protein
VWAWAVAQYPYLLPFAMTVGDGAAAPVTLRASGSIHVVTNVARFSRELPSSSNSSWISR